MVNEPKKTVRSIGVLFTDEEWQRINNFIDQSGLKKQFFFHEAILHELDYQELRKERK